MNGSDNVSRRPYVTRIVFACVLALAWAGAWPSAHEGHGGVPPVLREVRVGTERWLIGLGVVPTDPVVGEQLHIEVRATRLGGDGHGIDQPALADQVRLSVEGTNIQLRAARTPGVLAASHPAGVTGPHRLVVELRSAEATGRETFWVEVGAGPAQRLRPFVVAAFLLLSGMGALAAWRRWNAFAPADRGPLVPWIAGVAVVSVLGILLASLAVTPILAERFLPDRQPAAVDWIPDAPAVITGMPEALDTDPAFAPGEAPPGAAMISGRVVAAPDRVADVTVPMPGRILPLAADTVAVGRRVTKGQKLAILQPTYIMHDALHLINLRWPILQSMIDAKRRMLETAAMAARLKLALADGVVSVNDVEAAAAAAEAAAQEFERWSHTLAMHDEQIRDDQPGRVELSTPISGRVAAASFTQGQRVYEGDPLFTVIDLSTVWIEARVPERWIARFGGRTAEFTAFVDPSLTFVGHLQRRSAQIDAQTRTLSYFYAVDNPDELLRIGMLVHARLGADQMTTDTNTTPPLSGRR